MARRLTNEMCTTIAQKYFLCDQIKSVALKEAGYSDSYATRGGLKIFDNVRVKAAIVRVQQEMKARFDGSIEQSVKDYEQARALAMASNQPAAAVSAIRWRDGLFGLQTGDKGQEQTIIIISPKAPKVVESEVIDVDGQSQDRLST